MASASVSHSVTIRVDIADLLLLPALLDGRDRRNRQDGGRVGRRRVTAAASPAQRDQKIADGGVHLLGPL